MYSKLPQTNENNAYAKRDVFIQKRNFSLFKAH